MDTDPIHRTASSDGTEIAGRVVGQGPPLLLVPGALSDGEFIWGPLLPFLTERFTCYTMSMRGRGPLSGQHSDVRRERLIDDVVAFAESVGEPMDVFAWSQGGLLALGAAARTDAIATLTAFEPFVTEAFTEEELGDFIGVITRMGEVAAEGRVVDAARAFFEWLTNDDELAEAEALGLFEGFGRNVVAQLQEFQAMTESEVPSATDPSELGKITARALILHGTRSVPGAFWPDGARHVAEHVDGAQLRAVPGAGHFGPVCYPEVVAGELIGFLEAARLTS